MPTVTCRLSPNDTSRPEDCAAALHRFLEHLADLGLVYTWHITRDRHGLASSAPRALVATFDTPSLLQVQSVLEAPQGDAHDLRNAVFALGALSDLEPSAQPAPQRIA